MQSSIMADIWLISAFSGLSASKREHVWQQHIAKHLFIMQIIILKVSDQSMFHTNISQKMQQENGH